MSGVLDEFFVLVGGNSGGEFTYSGPSPDLDKAGSIEAGMCTFRGRSFPFEAIFGVLMDRERVSPVWASIRCKESSGFKEIW